MCLFEASVADKSVKLTGPAVIISVNGMQIK